MRKTMIALGLVLAFGGCKKDKWQKALSDTEGFKNQMCACKDKACTEDVHKKYEAWQDELMKSMGKNEEPPKDVEEKADKIEKEMRTCRHKFDDNGAAGDTGTAAPADNGSAGSGSAAAPAAPAAPAPAPAPAEGK